MYDRFYEIEESCQITGLEYIYQGVFGRKKDGAFVEVGAHDGRTWSNTYPLAKLGWRGIYIEPIKELYDRCVGNHKDHPNVTCIQALISNRRGETELYHTESDVNTIKKFEHENAAIGKMQMQRLTDVLLAQQDIQGDTIDLLVVDAEFTDLDVLRSADIGIYILPRMIIVEAHEFHPDWGGIFSKDIDEFFETIGVVYRYKRATNYRKIYSDNINSIYIL